MTSIFDFLIDPGKIGLLFGGFVTITIYLLLEKYKIGYLLSHLIYATIKLVLYGSRPHMEYSTNK